MNIDDLNDIIEYNHNINYKNSWEKEYIYINQDNKTIWNINVVDLEKYFKLNKNIDININTLISKFNKIMIKPFKNDLSTVINEKYINIYNNEIIKNKNNNVSNINKLLLYNAFNEWGEYIEPSNIYLSNYLNIKKITNYNEIDFQKIYLPEHNNWHIIENYLECIKYFNYNYNYKNLMFIGFYIYF